MKLYLNIRVCPRAERRKGGIMNKRTSLIVLAALAVFLAAGCAPTAITPAGAAGTENGVAGFWKGLWHGFIVLFTFIISLFKDNIGIYEANNSGNLYNLGFVLGVMIFFGGSGGGACKKGR
jgi:hypothetical protein